MLTTNDTPPLKGKGSKLTKKMELFVEEYFVDLNASQACLRAGYRTKSPHKMGTKLLHHPLIAEAIRERTEQRKEETKLSADYVVTKLIAIAERTEEGNPTAALRALELLGKTLSLFKDRQEISGPDGEAIQVKQEQIKQNVDEFTSKIERLASRNSSQSGTEGTGSVVEFPHGRREG